MFDIGFTELLVIGVVALIVVGPKDLPGMFRTLGRFTARARGMAREFTAAMNDAADEAGAKDIAKTLKGATSPKAMGLDALNKAADSFDKWDPSKGMRPSGIKGKGAEADSAGKSGLSEERAEAARKIHAATSKAAIESQAAAAAKSASTGNAAASPAASSAKPAATKTPAKTAKKPTAKKPAAKKPTAKTAATKTPAAKPAAKKTTPKAKPKSTDTSDA